METCIYCWHYCSCYFYCYYWHFCNYYFIVEIVSIVVVFGVCSIVMFDVVVTTDNQWALAIMLLIVVVGLQAPLVLAFVVMLLFNLQQLIAMYMVNDFRHQHVW